MCRLKKTLVLKHIYFSLVYYCLIITVNKYKNYLISTLLSSGIKSNSWKNLKLEKDFLRIWVPDVLISFDIFQVEEGADCPLKDKEGIVVEGEGDKPAPDLAARSLEQREWRVHELVESEKDYVSDLAQCCQYIYYMRQSKDEETPDIPMPEDLRQGKDRMIFGNLEMIYEWHREYVLYYIYIIYICLIFSYNEYFQLFLKELGPMCRESIWTRKPVQEMWTQVPDVRCVLSEQT